MTMIRRFGFFIVLNIVVVLTISLVTQLLGIGPYLSRGGMNYGALIVFCLLWGMGGAFISLLLSKMMVKWTMGVQIIDPQTRDSEARWVLETVHRLARQAGLKKMPEVGYYDSPDVNAFATGPTRNNSLVAVSTGLVNAMDRDAVEGVLGHEVSHIANGDMVTMTLLQGVVNAFVMALARIVAFALDNFLRGDRDDRGGGLGHLGYMLTVFVLEMLLFIPGSFVIGWFSRQREFRADAGSARLAGRGKMVVALQSLQRIYQPTTSEDASFGGNRDAVAALKINGGGGGFLAKLASTHPSLEDRIERLQNGAY